MAIAKLGYEPRRFNKNEYTDESDTESDCESDNAANKSLKPKFFYTYFK